jgi:hypothetical protein
LEPIALNLLIDAACGAQATASPPAQVTSCNRAAYSARNACIGSTLVARRAGT